MGLASILKRRRKGQFESVSICCRDSISSLPDEILGKILSLLPTKLAAATSVLSKRWRNLLPLVDSLDFDDSIFLYPERGDEEAISSGFCDFVDKTVALLSTCPIKSFSVNGRYEDSRVDGWIHTAMQRSLSELHLRCHHRIDRLFEIKTLVKLTLSDGCVIEEVPKPERNGDLFFPALKSLYIGDVVIDYSNYYNLMDMCPVLEELFIRNEDDQSHPPCCWPRGVSGGDSMKRLVIYFHLPKYQEEVYEHEVWIIPSKLVYLEYSSYVSKEYFISDMNSLVEARLDLRLWESTTRYDDDTERDEDEYAPVNGFSEIFGDVTIFLRSLSYNLKTLHLSADSLEAIHFSCKYITKFTNLLTLSFESDKDKSWQVLPRLLKKTPNLETLAIKGLVHRVTGRCGDVCPCVPRRHLGMKETICQCRKPKPKVSCLPNLLVKVLEISGYGGTCREIGQMRHFLGKLKCLQLVKIGVQPEADNNNLRLDLMALPRLSSKCDIQFI